MEVLSDLIEPNRPLGVDEALGRLFLEIFSSQIFPLSVIESSAHKFLPVLVQTIQNTNSFHLKVCSSFPPLHSPWPDQKNFSSKLGSIRFIRTIIDSKASEDIDRTCLKTLFSIIPTCDPRLYSPIFFCVSEIVRVLATGHTLSSLQKENYKHLQLSHNKSAKSHDPIGEFQPTEGKILVSCPKDCVDQKLVKELCEGFASVSLGFLFNFLGALMEEQFSIDQLETNQMTDAIEVKEDPTPVDRIDLGNLLLIIKESCKIFLRFRHLCPLTAILCFLLDTYLIPLSLSVISSSLSLLSSLSPISH